MKINVNLRALFVAFLMANCFIQTRNEASIPAIVSTLSYGAAGGGLMALWRIFHHWRSHPELVQQAGNNSTQHVPPSLKYYIPLLAESLVCGGVGGAILQMAGGFALSYVVAHMSSSPFMAAANVAGIPKIFPIPVQLFSSGMLATCIGTRAPQ